MTIARFELPYEAHIAKSALNSAGIDALVLDEHTINMNLLYSNAMGGVRLQVLSADMDDARKLLAEDYSDQLENEEVYACPKCSGEKWEPFTKGKKPAILTWILLGLPLFFLKNTLRCKNCGYTK